MPLKCKYYDVDFEDDLGNGMFGIVYKGQDTRNGREVAVKKASKKRSDHGEGMAENEIRILKFLGKHTNIIQLYDSSCDIDNTWIIIEFCDLGLLESYCRQNNEVGVDQIESFVCQCADAVEFLHTRSPPVIHRDIKPGNILLKKQEDGSIGVKLCDFGLSQMANEHKPVETWFLYSDVGTLGFKAPEMYEKKKYTVSADVFSLGLVVYALVLFGDKKTERLQPMIGGKCPGQRLSETKKDLEIADINHKSLCHYNDIISGMIKYDPKQRSSIQKVVEQLKNLRDDENEQGQTYAPEEGLDIGWETMNLCIYEKPTSEGKTLEVLGSDNNCLIRDDELYYDLDKMKADLITKHKDVTQRVLEIADILDEQGRDVRIARTSFAAGGIVGGGLAIGGFVAAFFTFGASLVLTGVGIGIGVVSGAGNIATIVADRVIGDKRFKLAQESLEGYFNSLQEYLTLKLSDEEIGKNRETDHKVDSVAPVGAAAFSASAGLAGGAVIAEAVTVGESIGQTVSVATRSTFQVLGVGAKVVSIGGAALSGFGVAINLGELVYNLVHIHKKTPSETAEILRKYVEDMQRHTNLL